MDCYQNLEKMNLILPPPPPKGGLYTPAKLFGDRFVYVSGCGPVISEPISGKLGYAFSLEQGQQYARNCALNMLSVLHAKLGDLNRVKSVIKLLVFVASTDDFIQQPQVANGASELFGLLFGDECGIASRSAIGTNVLPGNIPVEIEGLFELHQRFPNIIGCC